jgi:hypothetical protein
MLVTWRRPTDYRSYIGHRRDAGALLIRPEEFAEGVFEMSAISSGSMIGRLPSSMRLTGIEPML